MPRKTQPQQGPSSAQDKQDKASVAPAGPEKRRQPRFDSSQRLWCEGQPDPGAIRALNMSLGGMFIVGDGAQVGEQLRVSFSDEGEVICLDLEVVWTGAARAGGPEGAGTRIVGFSAGRDVYDRFVQREGRHQSHPPHDRTPLQDRPAQVPRVESQSRPPHQDQEEP